MTMRINLDGILKHQLYHATPPPETNNIGRPTPEERATLRLGSGRSPADNYFNQKLNVENRVNSMMANIHHHMKSTSPPRKAVPSVPAPIAEIPVSPITKNLKANLSSKNNRIKGGGGAVTASTKQAVMPISRIKAKLNQQSQQLMRRGILEMGPKSFTNQRRIREVLLQKTVLENMLLQHKRLQRDRQVIALDIQRMRQDLDRIKNKLDTSLVALNSTRTLYGNVKKGVAPAKLPTNTQAAVVPTGNRLVPKKAKAAVNVSSMSPKWQQTSAAQKRRGGK